MQMNINPDHDSAVYNEAKILYKCSHPFIIRCIEVFEVTSIMYVVTEFCKTGDLQMYQKQMTKGQPLDEERIKVLAKKIA